MGWPIGSTNPLALLKLMESPRGVLGKLRAFRRHARPMPDWMAMRTLSFLLLRSQPMGNPGSLGHGQPQREALANIRAANRICRPLI